MSRRPNGRGRGWNRGHRQKRFPLEPLRTAVEAESWSALARQLGVNHSVVSRYRSSGGVTLRMANEFCVRLGLTPDIVWGVDWCAEEPKKEERLPIEPLMKLARVNGVVALAEQLDVERKRLFRAKAAGGFTLDQADEFACRLGYVPDNVWGPDWDEERRGEERQATCEDSGRRGSDEDLGEGLVLSGVQRA